MEMKALLLCDAATVREGLLHVLGGGVTRMYRPALPAPFTVSVAAVVGLEEHELDRPHELHLLVKGPGGGRLVEAMGGLQVARPAKLEKREQVIAPLVIAVPPQAATDKYGKHVADFAIDGTKRGSLEFWVLDAKELELPPLTLPDL